MPNPTANAASQRASTLATTTRALAVAGLLVLGVPCLSQEEAPQEPQDASQAEPQAAPTSPEPAAELPEAIRTLLLGATEPSRSGAGVLAVEGSVLPERAGLIRRTPYGEWAFVFMGEDGQPRAMVLLPCRQLERMVESVEAIGAPAVRLTGQLTVYDRVNYLLPTNYAVITTPAAVERDAQRGDPQDAGDAGGTGAAAPDPLEAIDPQLRAIAEELEAGRQRARSLEAPVMAPPAVREQRGQGGPGGASGTGQSQDASQAVEQDVYQEGDRIVRQRARLERVRGLWTLRFDQDADGPQVRPPLIVLPSTSLRAMEQSVSRYGDQIAFEVSGTVYRYGQQPYVLITMHFIQPLEGLRPRG